MSIRKLNTIKNTFPNLDLGIIENLEPQTRLEEFNDYLRLLADMDNVSLKRKIVLLEGYIEINNKKTL
jgi:hypothetical protein